MVGDMSGAEEIEFARLQRECQQYKARLDAQAEELKLLRARFARYETALRGSQVTVYTQDRELRYTSISNPLLGHAIDDIFGRTDQEMFPPDRAATLVALKREALTTVQPSHAEIMFESASGPRWRDLHVEPLRNEAADIVGITCASIDVTERWAPIARKPRQRKI